MKELSASTILALHALHLMLRKRKPVTLREIHGSSRFDSDLIRAIVGKLRKSGLIRGRSGHGYVLAKAPGEIALQDVIQAVEKPAPPTAPCGGNFEACATRASCFLAPLCQRAEEGFQGALRSFTLAELADIPVDLPNCVDPGLKSAAS